MNFFSQLFSSPSSSSGKKPSDSTAGRDDYNGASSPIVSGANRLFGDSNNAVTGAAATSSLGTANLTRFHKNWNYVNGTLSSPTMEGSGAFGAKNPVPLAQVHLFHTDIPACLASMADILIDEEARMEPGSTGLCMEYLLKHNVIQTLSDLAASDIPRGKANLSLFIIIIFM